MAPSRWYKNLDLKNPEQKQELTKYLTMYKLVKADIRRLNAELARDTALPEKSASCYRSLLRAFDHQSPTKSMEAAKLMLAVGDPELLRALKRRYGRKEQCHRDRSLGPKANDAKPKRRPKSRLEVSGSVIHTVFSEPDQIPPRNADNACDVESRSGPSAPGEDGRKHHIRLDLPTMPTGTDDKSSRSSTCVKNPLTAFNTNYNTGVTTSTSVSYTNGTQCSELVASVNDKAQSNLCGYAKSLTSKVKSSDERPVSSSLNGLIESDPLRNLIDGSPLLKKSSSPLVENAQSYLSTLSLDDIKKKGVDKMETKNHRIRDKPVKESTRDPGSHHNGMLTGQNQLGYIESLFSSPTTSSTDLKSCVSTPNASHTNLAHSQQCPRPLSEPATLLSESHLNPALRSPNVLLKLQNRPGAIRLSDGRVCIAASLSQVHPADHRSSVRVPQHFAPIIPVSAPPKTKLIPMITVSSDQSQEMLKIPKAIYDDLYVVQHHRRSSFADGNSLVEVRPRSMPSAPTLIATQDARGNFSVPMDIASNQRAVISINAMRNVKLTG